MMNLAQFKKQKEDKKTVTMAHPDGHSITILKSKLAPIHRKQLEKMPVHLADGGDTSEEETAAPAPPPAMPGPPSPAPGVYAPPVPTPIDLPDMSSALPSPPQGDMQGQMVPPPPMPSPPPSAAPSGEHDNTPPPMPTKQEMPQAKSNAPAGDETGVVGAYQQGLKGLKEQQNYVAQAAKARADVEQNDIDARKQLQIDAQNNLGAFQKHAQEFKDYAAANPIDPKHYVENMGTGQKVATALGLLIGGFTGGFNKTGVNPAADWLNAQINRDIEGQKSRMDQQKTILGANQELYHDQVLAGNATRMNMNDIYEQKMKMAADKLGTPQALAAYDQMASKFKLENAGLLQQMAIRSSALEAIKRGGAGLDPLTLGQAGLIPPEEAQKEQQSLLTQRASINSVNNLYDRANQVQTATNAVLHPFERVKNIDLINAELADQVMKGDTVHRFSLESAKQFVEPYTVKLSDSPVDVVNKQQQLLNKVQEIHAAQTPYFSRVAPRALPNYSVLSDDQKAVQMAQQRLQANPNDKVAMHALQLNGINTRSVAR